MKKNKAILLFGLLFCLIGLAAWIYQMSNGLVVTNLSNSFSWGLYIAAFEFFVGAAAGGMLIFSLAYVLRLEYLKPMSRIAALVSLGCTIAAGASILPDIGRVNRIFQVLRTPNLSSPLVWDIAILCVFVIVSFLVVFFQLRRKNTDTDKDKASEKWSRRLAFVGLPLSIVLSVVTALLFSTQNSYEWWNSAVFPLDAVAVGGALGTAVVMLFSMLFFGRGSFPEHKAAYGFTAKIAAFCLLAHYILTAAELIPLLVNQTAENQALLGLLFGTYGWLYLPELILPAIAMVCFSKKLTNRSGPLLTSSLLVIVGAFIHKLMALLPAFNTIPLTLEVEGVGLWSMPVAVGTFTEGSDVFVTFWNYAPAPVEWAVCLLPLGITLAVVAGAMVLCPLISGTAEIPQTDTAHSV